MRRRYSRDHWRCWLEEQSASGLSISAFCLQRDIPEASFYYWRKKFAGEQIQVGHSEPPFMPVSVVSGNDFEVQFPDGVSMKVPRDTEAVRLIVDALVSRDSAGDECSA